MKLKTYSIAALLGAGLLIVNSANAQWTRNAVTSQTYLTNIGDNLGVGTTNPTFKVDVQSTGIATMSFKSATDNASFLLDRGASNKTASLTYRTAGVNNWQTGCVSNNNFQIRNNVLASLAFFIEATTNNVGVGTNLPTGRLCVTGGLTQTIPTLDAITTYVGTADVRGVNVLSKTADGWGYGVFAIGGYQGGYFEGQAGTYAGPAYGLNAYATGSAGVRYGIVGGANNTGGTAYGVFGSATGSTTENSWGGYFPTKTYMNELRVGSETGATGYIACIKGKLIAEEVRVALQAAWPDYVFDSNYNLMSISDLKTSITINKHLPGLPAACEVAENGLHLGEMQTKMVEKLEESYLYIIQLQQQIDELKAEMQLSKNQNKNSNR